VLWEVDRAGRVSGPNQPQHLGYPLMRIVRESKPGKDDYLEFIFMGEVNPLYLRIDDMGSHPLMLAANLLNATYLVTKTTT
jgi:hypothetical protein